MHQPRAVCLREQATIEQAGRENLSLIVGTFLVAGQQLLGHGVPIIMRQDMIVPHARSRYHSLHQIRLLSDGIGMSARFGGKAKAQKVGHNAEI